MIIIAKDNKVLGSAMIKLEPWGWSLGGIGKGDSTDVPKGIGLLLYEITLHFAIDDKKELFSDNGQTVSSRAVWAKLATEYASRFKIEGYDTNTGETFNVRLRKPGDPQYTKSGELIPENERNNKSLIPDDSKNGGKKYFLYSDETSKGSNIDIFDIVLRMKPIGKSKGKEIKDK